ncbi:hypothetical protein [Acanthopleuribacter pedis]|uniref:Uncharacterized protein n=1 Tax=Acanthopleuribacter pedis TaxID=442870 RepID=A0A8J7Q9X6_9BACT|nr:hypothetical protein [Acanthopleuribacter pedis]MBO1319699.1 hypothetical protein [Acanthopleuribacter pedis]
MNPHQPSRTRKSNLGLWILSLCLFPLCAVDAFANLRFKGEVALESRQFTDDDNDETTDAGAALFTRLEATFKRRRWRASVRGIARYDVEDDNREIYAIEEAWIGYRGRGWEFRSGYQMLNWTATEAFHPADFINSRNYDSNIENAEKLGELMISLRKSLGRGALTFYYMPRFEEPEFPGPSSRLSLVPDGFDLGPYRIWEDDGDLTRDKNVNQWGGRFTQTLDNVDLSLHYIDHIERNLPIVVPLDEDDFPDPDGTLAIPIYQRVIDVGGTYLQIMGPWIAKVEFSHKNFVKPDGFSLLPEISDHGQAAFGLEYGWATGSGADVVLLFEAQGLIGPGKERRAELNTFQRDVLLGYSHAWNDTMDRQLLVTVIHDVERSNETLINARYSQRLTDTWKIQGGFRIVEAPPKEEDAVGLELLHEANQVYLTLTRFF